MTRRRPISLAVVDGLVADVTAEEVVKVVALWHLGKVGDSRKCQVLQLLALTVRQSTN